MRIRIAVVLLLLVALLGRALADESSPVAPGSAGQQTVAKTLPAAIGQAVGNAPTPTAPMAPMATPSGASETKEASQDAEAPQASGAWVKWIAVVTVLSLAPALVILVTSFTRIVVVLGLLRQALATPQLPPNAVLFGLALLMTLVVMAPVIESVYGEAVGPLLEGKIDNATAAQKAETHVRGFMIRQMEAAGTTDAVYAFLDSDAQGQTDLKWEDVSTWTLAPAFVIGELKIAFLLGLRIFLPFVIIDLLVGGILVSMGMLMLPPVLISLPLKLLLFVLADGWALVAGTLMASFAAVT